MRCAVFTCNSDNRAKYNIDNVMFFRFPSDPVLSKAWQHACSRQDKINTANARVCSKHFKESDYVRNLQHELLGYTVKRCRKIKSGTIPTLNLPQKLHSASKCSFTRNEVFVKPNRLVLVNQLLNECIKQEGIDGDSFTADSRGDDVISYTHLPNNFEGADVKRSDKSTCTEFDHRDNIIAELRDEVDFLKSENKALRTAKLIIKTEEP